MYKTVRHGENSLQYTILPQTEEVLNNSGLKGKGRDYSPSIHVRRSRRKSSVKYVLLIVFGIVIALALAAVPLYVMNGALYRGKHQDGREIITNSPLTPTGREIVKSRKKELKITPEIISTIQSRLGASSAPSSTSSSTTTTSTTSTTSTMLPAVTEITTTTPWSMPALRSWKSTTSSTTSKPVPTIDDQGNPPADVLKTRLPDHYSAKEWADILASFPRPTPTVTFEPYTIRNVFRLYSASYIPTEKIGTVSPKILDDVLIKFKTTTRPTTELPRTSTTERSKLKDLKEAILSVDDDDDFKESLEVEEVFSLPPLKPEIDDEVTVSKASDWYAARWPFVDTSSYFQWSSYSPGDNLLFPLLVGALSSVALVVLLAVAVRRKRSPHSGEHLGHSAEAQVDDNTNLLAAENPDDGEGEE